jgi:hypothetical protein
MTLLLLEQVTFMLVVFCITGLRLMVMLGLTSCFSLHLLKLNFSINSSKVDLFKLMNGLLMLHYVRGISNWNRVWL